MTNFDPPPDWMQAGLVIYATHPDPEGRVMGADTDSEPVHLTGQEPLLVLDVTKTGMTAHELRVLDPTGRALFDSAVITFLASCYGPQPLQD